jgi:hypothetical protein
MQIRLPCVAALVGLLFGTSLAAQASSPEERRLLVLEAPGNVLTQTARDRLHAAIAEIAIAKGLTLASGDSLPAKLLVCDLPGGLPPIAAASGAVFVLRVEAKFAQESFKLAIELWNSDEGKLLGKERRDCPICDEQDLWGSAAFLTRGLLDRAIREPTPPVAAAIAGRGELGLASGAAPALIEIPKGSTGSLARYSGAVLAVAGLAALATGIYYWSVDGEHAGAADSDRVRDTRKLGLPLTIVGGTALVAGAGLWGWSFWAGPAKVAVGPSGIRVAGSF